MKSLLPLLLLALTARAQVIIFLKNLEGYINGIPHNRF